MSDSDRPHVKMKTNARPSRSYKCGRCGQDKKGHVCPMSSKSGGVSFIVTQDASSALSSVHATYKDEEDEDDGAPPPLALFAQPLPTPFQSLSQLRIDT